jgi:hypothetical protein
MGPLHALSIGKRGLEIQFLALRSYLLMDRARSAAARFVR